MDPSAAPYCPGRSDALERPSHHIRRGDYYIASRMKRPPPRFRKAAADILGYTPCHLQPPSQISGATPQQVSSRTVTLSSQSLAIILTCHSEFRAAGSDDEAPTPGTHGMVSNKFPVHPPPGISQVHRHRYLPQCLSLTLFSRESLNYRQTGMVHPPCLGGEPHLQVLSSPQSPLVHAMQSTLSLSFPLPTYPSPLFQAPAPVTEPPIVRPPPRRPILLPGIGGPFQAPTHSLMGLAINIKHRGLLRRLSAFLSLIKVTTLSVSRRSSARTVNS